MNFIKRLANTGISYADSAVDKRNVLIVNYFALIHCLFNLFLVLLRTILYFTISNRKIIINTNFAFIAAACLFLLPLLFNRQGYLRLARFYLCWLPSVIVMVIYISDGMRRTHILAAEYDSIYFFLLGVSALPYLLLSTRNKKEFIFALSLPFLFILFTDKIFHLFGMSHAQKGTAGDGFEINRFRAILAYFPLNACCMVMKLLVENRDLANDKLIAELEEKNKLIDEQTEKVIKESESRYRLLFEQAADAITIINKETKFEKVNPSACELFGYPEEEFLQLKLEDVLEKNALAQSPLNWSLLKDYKNVHIERTLIRKDGSIFPAEINVKMLPDGSFQSFIRDITDRKKAEQELIEAESKFRNLVEKSLVGVYIIKNEKLIYVNPKFAEIFGYHAEELIDYPVESIIDAADWAGALENVRKRIEGEIDGIRYEVNGRKKNGDLIRIEIFGSKTQYKGEHAIIGTLLDITENRLLQLQVIQEQKRITRAVLIAEERERNRIGQELHDNVNQILAGTKLYLGMASKDEFAGRGLIKSSLELVDNAIDEMRSLSKEQVTPIRGIDLADLVYSLIDKLSVASNIKTTVAYKLANENIDDDLKLNIYRIIQEQMNNILKHSDATYTNISLTDNKNYLYVSIKDDGKGFDTKQKRRGIGLANMNNRVESFNGEFIVNSDPGNGCEIKITIPY
jgi:PAS domain S-box-containing protein